MENVDIIRAIESAGLTPPETIINDGLIHRFSSNGNKSDLSGWYVAFPDGGCVFGDWRTSQKNTVDPSGFNSWTDAEKQEYRDRIQKAKAEAKKQREKEQAAAAEKALQIWESAKPADPEHPYLKKKQIGTHGARQTGKTLIYSITDATGKIISLQSIDEAGNKKFLPGGRISGGFYIIGHGDFEHGGGICEGIATGASIYEATGKPVICALISGNLPAVAKQFKNYPFIIYADNDIQTTEKIGKNPGVIAAQKAADVSGLQYIICPVDSDFNDLHCQKGLGAVKKFIAENKPTSGEADTWPDPEPLFASYDPEPFPIDALPSIFRNAVDEVREYVQAPIPMIISSALGAASIAIQGHYDVKRDEGLTGPCSLFLWVVADSGERKTTVDGYFIAGIRAFESEKRQEMQPEIEAYEREVKILKAKEDGLLQAIKQAKINESKSKNIPALESELAKLAELQLAKPKIPEFLRGDDTPEAQGYFLSHCWPSAGVVSSEAGSIFGAHGMQDKNLMRNLAFLNERWDGGTSKIGRRTSESYIIDRGCRLSVSLMVQESALRAFIESTNGLARGTGFLARPLPCWPETTQGTRFYKPAPKGWPNLGRFNARIREILLKEFPLDEEGNLRPHELPLSPEAKQIWIEFYNHIESMLADGGAYEDFRDIASKTADNAARIAAIFQVMDNFYSKAVEADCMRAGAVIAEWYLTEARRLWGEISTSEEISAAAKLDAWLIKHCMASSVNSLERSFALTHGPGRLRKKKALDAALSELKNLHRVREVTEDKKTTIQINPQLLANANPANSAKRQADFSTFSTFSICSHQKTENAKKDSCREGHLSDGLSGIPESTDTIIF